MLMTLLVLLWLFASVTGIFGPRKLVFVSMACGFLFGSFAIIYLSGFNDIDLRVTLSSGVFFLLFFGIGGFITRYRASGTTSIRTFFKSLFS